MIFWRIIIGGSIYPLNILLPIDQAIRSIVLETIRSVWVTDALRIENSRHDVTRMQDCTQMVTNADSNNGIK